MPLSDEIEKLQRLREQGALTEDEFQRAKARLIDNEPAAASSSPPPLFATDNTDYARNLRQWAMYLHLSQLLGYALPVLGFVAPVVIWQIKKDEMPELEEHGRMVTNWMISSLVYYVIGVLLLIVLIGVPLLVAIGVCGVVFPVVGGIKASNGEFWNYPMTIKFL
jgi:uncharacterized Tic20 family protein